MRRLNNSYFFAFLSNHLIYYPTPVSLTYAWSFGFLAGMCLVTQMISGIFLAMHYTPHVDLAFSSVEYIMRDVPNGWFLRYVHANGASMFFIVVYSHIFRGLYYGSYMKPREFLRCLGILLPKLIRCEKELEKPNVLTLSSKVTENQQNFRDWFLHMLDEHAVFDFYYNSSRKKPDWVFTLKITLSSKKLYILNLLNVHMGYIGNINPEGLYCHKLSIQRRQDISVLLNFMLQYKTFFRPGVQKIIDLMLEATIEHCNNTDILTRDQRLRDIQRQIRSIKKTKKS